MMLSNGGQTKKYRFLGLESRTGLNYVDFPVVVVVVFVLRPKYKRSLQKGQILT